MLRKIQSSLTHFFERNLFERIIIYTFFSAFIVKVIFEVGLGQWSFTQSQNLQWVFFSLLAFDYLINFKKVINIRVTINPMSLLSLLFLVMCAHGLFVGFYLGNDLFTIFNDFVPLFIIALNILRMQSLSEYKDIDLQYLLKVCTFFVVGTVIFGFLGEALGKRTHASLGNSVVYLPLVMSAMLFVKPFPRISLFFALFSIAMTIGDINRTSLVFLFCSFSLIILIKTIKNPVYGLFITLIGIMLIAGAINIVPEDSKTYQRVANITQIDLSERKGSVGERQAEWDAIQNKLEEAGKSVQIVGLGFGGVYDVARTHEFLEDQGHAHYAWAWFSLRFGALGYIYMCLFIAALVYNGARNFLQKDGTGFFIFFLCLMGLVYCLTHVNTVWLQSGVHFLYRKNPIQLKKKNYE